ncbi:MAG: sigma-70 family RNA polymerase sigma factor [Actinocatenispora sp.]
MGGIAEWWPGHVAAPRRRRYGRQRAGQQVSAADAGGVPAVDPSTARVQSLALLPAGVDRVALRARVIESLLPLAYRLARRYRGLGVPLDDLRQVAAAGLIKSVDGYRATEGPFIRYAVPTITGELRRHLRDRAWVVRPPRSLQELALSVYHASETLHAELGRAPRSTELAAAVAAPDAQVREAMLAFRAYMAVSLDSAASTGAAPLRDLLPAADRDIDAALDRLALTAAIATLPARERAIIRMRFLDEQTQQEIGRRMGLSQAHVSGILARTLTVLRRTLCEEETAPAVPPVPPRRVPTYGACARASGRDAPVGR